MIKSNKSVHVFLFSTDPKSNRGGIANATSTLMACFDKLDVEVTAITTHSPHLSKIENSLLFARSLSFFLYKIVALRLSKKESLKIYAYLQVGPRGSLIRKLLLAFFAKLFKCIICSHYHSIEFDHYLNGDRFLAKPLRLLARLSNRNLVLSRWWIDRFQIAGIERLFIVPNCVNQSDVASKNLNRKSIKKSLRLLTLGRLEYGKNFDLIIRTLKHLPDSTILKIAGDGSLKESLITLSDDLGYSDRVNFTGWASDDLKSLLYEDSDFLVLPSSKDSFGLVFIEALAHGCPVVISPNPTIQSALEELEGVFISQGRSEQSLAKAIIDASAITVDRHSISKTCINKYGTDKVASLLEKALDI